MSYLFCKKLLFFCTNVCTICFFFIFLCRENRRLILKSVKNMKMTENLLFRS